MYQCNYMPYAFEVFFEAAYVRFSAYNFPESWLYDLTGW